MDAADDAPLILIPVAGPFVAALFETYKSNFSANQYCPPTALMEMATASPVPEELAPMKFEEKVILVAEEADDSAMSKPKPAVDPDVVTLSLLPLTSAVDRMRIGVELESVAAILTTTALEAAELAVRPMMLFVTETEPESTAVASRGYTARVMPWFDTTV